MNVLIVSSMIMIKLMRRAYLNLFKKSVFFYCIKLYIGNRKTSFFFALKHSSRPRQSNSLHNSRQFPLPHYRTTNVLCIVLNRCRWRFNSIEVIRRSLRLHIPIRREIFCKYVCENNRKKVHIWYLFWVKTLFANIKIVI